VIDVILDRALVVHRRAWFMKNMKMTWFAVSLGLGASRSILEAYLIVSFHYHM
jgi:hypothetical protein